MRRTRSDDLSTGMREDSNHGVHGGHGGRAERFLASQIYACNELPELNRLQSAAGKSTEPRAIGRKCGRCDRCVEGDVDDLPGAGFGCTRGRAVSRNRGSARGGEQGGPRQVVLGGERRGVLIEGFDLGNSPAEYTPERVMGGRCLSRRRTARGRFIMHDWHAESLWRRC